MKAIFAGQGRMALIFLASCTMFLVLHSAVGGLQNPSFIPAETFPKKIWQSWKVDALRFEDRDTERAMSWTTKNAAHRYEVLTDDSAMTYVEQHYGPTGLNRPDIVYTYRSLNSIRIIQSDLLRYLIMYAEGGVWADIDVEAVRSIEHFIPKRFNEKDINMVIGVETDEPDFKGAPSECTTTRSTSVCVGPSSLSNADLLLLNRSSPSGFESTIVLPVDVHVQASTASDDEANKQHLGLAEQPLAEARCPNIGITTRF